MLKDIVTILQRWDVWKRVEAAPERLDALEKRVAEIERRLAPGAAESCPSCGAPSLAVVKRVQSTSPLGALGARDEHLKCGACGFTEVRLID